jgi:hypothetical protein
VTSRALTGSMALLVLLGGCAGKPPAASRATSGTPSPSAAFGSADQRIEVSIAQGKISGTTGRVQVTAGSRVTLVLTSDVADQVHLHGYDIEKELAPGQPTSLQFVAALTGVFEVELHKANLVLLRLQVG